MKAASAQVKGKVPSVKTRAPGGLCGPGSGVTRVRISRSYAVAASCRFGRLGSPPGHGGTDKTRSTPPPPIVAAQPSSTT